MENNLISHSVSLDDRKSLNITGIKEVVSFDDITINLVSNMGKMTIKGEKLHITSFDEDVGVIIITGLIHGIVYISDCGSSGGFFSKIFR